MKNYNILILVLFLSVSLGCTDHSGFLSRNPKSVLLEDQLWSNPSLVLSNLGNLYNRIPQYQELEKHWEFTNFDEAFPSRNGDYWRVQNQTYDYNWWSYWDYGYIHDINMFISRARNADGLDQKDRDRFLSEAHFLRANVYFELVKRMGGVPLIKDTLRYDFSGDPTYLQHPRAKESEVYDFVLAELDSAAVNLPDDPNIKSRVTWGAAMALKSRVALYAGSIAKYGATTPSVSLPGGEVGIPADRADEYYQIALDAAQEVIDSKGYSLYEKLPDNLEDNFAQLFLDKNGNPEVIFAKDYKLQSRTTQFTVQSQPKSLTEEGAVAGFLNPSLNLVQSFEMLDNTFAPLPNVDPVTGEYIAYDSKSEIFEGRDARLGGTVILPGSQFKGQDLDIWAGYLLSNGDVVTGSNFGQKKVLPGQTEPTQVVGFDGPIDQLELGTQTGFYLRKYLDPNPSAGRIGTGSDVWWIYLRFGEVLLNAAEAAYELGDNDLAADYMNHVRQRAGFTTDLLSGDITFDRIVHERRVELAFEGHQLWDMKRWRLAHKVWNGASTELTDNPGLADEPSTRIFGLWPYKIHDTGNPDHGKWIFKEVIPSVVTNAHQFRLGNYYSEIPSGVLANNPKLVPNPNQ